MLLQLLARIKQLKLSEIEKEEMFTARVAELELKITVMGQVASDPPTSCIN